MPTKLLASWDMRNTAPPMRLWRSPGWKMLGWRRSKSCPAEAFQQKRFCISTKACHLSCQATILVCIPPAMLCDRPSYQPPGNREVHTQLFLVQQSLTRWWPTHGRTCSTTSLRPSLLMLWTSRVLSLLQTSSRTMFKFSEICFNCKEPGHRSIGSVLSLWINIWAFVGGTLMATVIQWPKYHMTFVIAICLSTSTTPCPLRRMAAA